MKRITVVIAMCAALTVSGCETDDQIADRVISQRANMQEAVGMKVLAVKQDGRRRTVVVLDSDRAIIFESTKHEHTVGVCEYFAEKSDEVQK